MPAAERSFSDPLPEQLYCDADFMIAFLVEGEPHHIRARSLLDRAVEAGTTLYLSSLSWLEYINVVIKERFRDRLPADVRQRFHLRQWQRASVRRTYIEFMLDAFDEVFRQVDGLVLWNDLIHAGKPVRGNR